jgi:hypothetical protein
MTGVAEFQTPRPHLEGASNWQVVPVSLIFGCVSLWDFYIGELRIFDFAALVLTFLFLALAAVMRLGAPAIERRTVAPAAAIFVLILAFSVMGIGLHPDNLKPSIGMLLGVLVLVLTRCVSMDEQLIDRSIYCVAWLHVLAFFFQLIYFYSTKQVVNYHLIVGLQPRLQAAVFRAAGFFLEPAIYCFLACSLFLLRRQRKQIFGMLDTLLLVSMILSFSLWGVAVGVSLLVLFRTRVAFGILLAILVVFSFAFSALDLSHSPVYRFFENRLTSIGSDRSALGRYGGTFDWISGLLSDRTVLFGNGINNFFEEHGSNGWAFIVNSIGVVGTSVLFMLFVSLAPPRKWFLFGISFAILLTAAPLWKTLYFWFWIALMLRPSSGAGSSKLQPSGK